MKKAEILDQLQEIFRDIFANDELIIHDTTTASDIKEWDSLMHIRIVVALEKQFQIKLNISEMSKLKTVGDMINAIEKNN